MVQQQLWSEMTEPVSLEEHAGEKIPVPTPGPSIPPDNWVQLPQSSGQDNSGYYVYGTDETNRPGTGANGQYGEARTIKMIQDVGREFAKGDVPTPFGVGNISLQGGGEFKPHTSHRDGLGFDARPVRADGKAGNMDYRHSGYDREGTKRLFRTIIATGQAKKILFNDPEILEDPEFEGVVMPWPRHNNHFHVQLR
jgi:hypothetical protein